MRNYMEHMVAFRATMPQPEGFIYNCIEDYVLDRGTDAKKPGILLTEDEATILWEVVDRRGARYKQKECFYNAQLLVLADESGQMQYNEGYASGRGFIPVHHGWVTLNGKVIDLTWRTAKPNHHGRLRNRVIGAIPEGWEYRGVQFPKSEIKRRIVESKMVEAFLGDYRNNFPHLRETRRQSKPTPLPA